MKLYIKRIDLPMILDLTEQTNRSIKVRCDAKESRKIYID